MIKLGPRSHVVWKHGLNAGKPFFPRGPELQLGHFQEILKRHRGKLLVASDLLERYSLEQRTKMGRELVSEVAPLADYLYDNVIHPRFFAEALHVIASNAKALDPILDHVQLRRLQRENLATALGTRKVNPADLGQDFRAFKGLPKQEKLAVLERLGVLVLKQGQQLPEISPARPSSRPEPRPRVKQVASTDPQLNLFTGLVGKKGPT